ncbi:MAG TPA: MarR family transcriptional regulator [Longimicrobium sp.]|jgi:DNA-binding MarR family transcriptional regulator|uniref:MarR family winged helix-turn-helix transcriptional regulator n=1 Tax=Longimicrobium sp. TaxID=2029185 RepID=UPI002EDA1DC5
MAGRIQAEIRQNKPVGSVEEEVYLNLQRTANALSQPLAELLRGHDLTPAQYNVLRILRGAGDDGLTASDIGGRMISRDPDITRLVDRLEKRGLVERRRCSQDRRVVWTRISEGGRALIDPLDTSMDEMHRAMLAHMPLERMRMLVELLEEARDGAPAA